MNKDNYIKPIRRVRRQLILITILFVIGSVMTFALVEFEANVILGKRGYDPIDAVGMIIPMGFIIGGFAYYVLQNTNRYFSQLLKGISRVAKGDFDVSLDVEKARTFREIFSDFNKMSRELKGVQTLRDDFVNQFSHEFKTPVMSINGFAQLMLEEELSREEQIRYLKIIASESERLSDLANNTLLLARLESQQWILNKVPYDLDEQIKECIILLEPEWAQKELMLEVDLQPIVYKGNREIMKQLWINLLSNAIRYTPEKGKISVSLKAAGDSSVIEISDSGCGIAEKDIPYVFNKYYRAKENSSSRGLGLGLSIVKKIVDLCNGRIEVSSRIGEGSSFTISLPPGIENE